MCVYMLTFLWGWGGGRRCLSMRRDETLWGLLWGSSRSPGASWLQEPFLFMHVSIALSVHPSIHRQTDWPSDGRSTNEKGSKAGNQQTSKAKHAVIRFCVITFLFFFGCSVFVCVPCTGIIFSVESFAKLIFVCEVVVYVCIYLCIYPVMMVPKLRRRIFCECRVQ